MDLPVGDSVPSFSYRERFVIVLGIAILVFSAFGIFGGESKVIFICLMALCIVSFIVVQQVKELRRATATLFESEERFRLLLNEVQDYAIFAVSPSGKIASWSHGAERMAGYSAQEIIGQPFSVLRTNDGVPESESVQIFETARQKERFQEEAWYKAKDGRRFLTNTAITPLLTDRKELRGYCVVIGDITAKKESERELLESYRFIERITHTIPNIIFILNLIDLQKIYINEEVGSILGYSPPELEVMGAGLFETILHPDDKTHFRLLRQRCATIPDGEIVELDCRMKHAMGGWRWLSCRIVVFARSPEGTPTQFLGIAQDVTALKASQDEAKHMSQVALSQQRLAMLGELSAGVAHEIRNPLQGILSCVEELRNHFDGNTTNVVSTIGLLEDGLQRMDQISGRLLRLARNQDGEKVLSNVAQCISETCAFVQSRAQKSGIALHTEIEPGLPLVPMHAELISEALLNLLNNALDACDQGGCVTVSALRSKEAGMFELRVSDEGCGIPPEARERIFDAFFTTKVAGKGTGLGMTIVRKNVEAHGGTVELADTSTKGTTFRVLIPLAPALSESESGRSSG